MAILPWRDIRIGLDILARALWPGRCVTCGALLNIDEDLACVDCATTIFNAPIGLAPPEHVDACWAAFQYRGAIQDAMHAWKYDGREAVGRSLADLLLDRMSSAVTIPTVPIAVVPVPLHPRRIRQRGFDQTLYLARRIARHLPNASLRNDILKRARDTKSQAGLDRPGRMRNVAGAFRPRGPLQGVVALVDDVITTGATVAACASALREAGATAVVALAVARAADERYDDGQWPET